MPVENPHVTGCKSAKSGTEAHFSIDLGDDLEDAIEKFGGDTVFGIFRAQAIVKAQGFARNKLDNLGEDESVPDVEVFMENKWNPNLCMRRPVDPVKQQERMTKAIDRLDAEGLEKLRLEIEAKLDR